METVPPSNLGDPISRDPESYLASLNPDQLEQLIHDLFNEQDRDGNRTLDREEFRAVFNNLGNKLGLKKNDIRRILAEADRDENGRISYREFIPVAVSIIESIVAKWALRKNEEKQAAAYKNAELQIYHGMPEHELDAILSEIFRKADKDGNGALDADEFEKCLQDIHLGFTRKEINVMMYETDSDHNGKIDYEEFKPLCKQLLIELTAQEWLQPAEDQKAMEKLLLDAFQEADKEDTGILPGTVISNCIYKLDLGLTCLQVCSIMSEADEVDEDEDMALINYTEFAPKAAFMIFACQNYREIMTKKKERMQSLHASEDWGMVFGMDRDTLEHNLAQSFAKFDVDNTGTLSRMQIKSALISTLDVDKKTFNALMAIAKQTETGAFLYQPIIEEAFRTLKGMEELAIIYE